MVLSEPDLFITECSGENRRVRCACAKCVLRKFHGAVGRNDVRAVIGALTAMPGLLNSPVPGSGGKTAIFKAIECHRLKMVELLMANGADMTQRYGQFNPLEEALAMSESMRCRPIADDIALLLLRFCDLVEAVPAGVDQLPPVQLDFTFGHWGGTIYHLMCMPENTRCNWNYRELFGTIAMRARHGDPVPDINASNGHGISPLAMACYYNKNDTFLDVLEDAGADLWLSPVEMALLREHNDWCSGEQQILKRQARAQIKHASLVRSFGRSKTEVYPAKVPDEIWREIIGFIIIR